MNPGFAMSAANPGAFGSSPMGQGSGFLGTAGKVFTSPNFLAAAGLQFGTSLLASSGPRGARAARTLKPVTDLGTMALMAGMLL